MSRNVSKAVELFTRDEVGYLKSLVRQEIRKQDQKLDRLIEKFGDRADLEPTHDKIEMLDSMYIKLGGDPAEMTTMQDATS